MHIYMWAGRTRSPRLRFRTVSCCQLPRPLSCPPAFPAPCDSLSSMARIIPARIAKSRSKSPVSRKSSPPPSSRRGKPPGHIPRPPNAFILFRKELNARSVQSGEAHQKSVSSVACALWHKLKESDPAKLETYYRQAEELKAQHKRDYPDYIYRPRKRLTEKKRRMCRTTVEEEDMRKQKVLQAHVKATGSSPIAIDDLDEYETASVATTKRSRPKRGQKPRGKVAHSPSKALTSQTTPSRASPASDVSSVYYPDTPDAFDVPTLVSTPISSPASPTVATPFVDSTPLCDLSPSLPGPQSLDGLLPLPMNFQPAYGGPVSFGGMDYGTPVEPSFVDANLVAMPWVNYADNGAGPFMPQMHTSAPLSAPLLLNFPRDVGLKPYSQDHVLTPGCDFQDQDMSQFFYNDAMGDGQVPLY
ncbi:hypothetical protein AURDEDRAFT_147195 [Auricularia subglabra TFB-10046 SS5]|nr:hypothetical protein AURDEDRAFT_147195 [Auricularia subglabra TFB-10046 SS5]